MPLALTLVCVAAGLAPGSTVLIDPPGLRYEVLEGQSPIERDLRWYGRYRPEPLVLDQRQRDRLTLPLMLRGEGGIDLSGLLNENVDPSDLLIPDELLQYRPNSRFVPERNTLPTPDDRSPADFDRDGALTLADLGAFDLEAPRADLPGTSDDTSEPESSCAVSDDGVETPSLLANLSPSTLQVLETTISQLEQRDLAWKELVRSPSAELRVAEILRDVEDRLDDARRGPDGDAEDIERIIAEGSHTLLIDLVYMWRFPDSVEDFHRQQLESLYTYTDEELGRVFDEYDASESVREKVQSHYDVIKSQAFSFVDHPRIASMSKIRTEEQMASLAVEVSRVGIETAREFRQAMDGMFLDGHEPGSREHEKGLTHLLRDSAEFLASRPFQLYATSSFSDFEGLNDLPEVTGMRIAYVSGSPAGFFLVRYLNE